MPYKYDRILSPEEHQVLASGYRWVTTNPLQPHLPGAPIDPYAVGPDRLEPHGHGSKNTHVVLKGELIINPNRHGSIYDKNCITVHAPGSGRCFEASARPNQRYRGWAGPEGALFIEGHMILSPDTAKRFQLNGTLRWESDETSDCEEKQKKNWFKKEIKENRHANPPMAIDPTTAREL